MLKSLILRVWNVKKKKPTAFSLDLLSLSKTAWPVYICGLRLFVKVKVAQSICPPPIKYIFVPSLHSFLQPYPLFLTQLKSLPLNAIQNYLTPECGVTGVPDTQLCTYLITSFVSLLSL